MDLLMDLQNLIKSKIRFTTSDGDYEGVVRLVCPVTKKIIIEQLFFLPKCLFMGVLHFNISEILTYKLISKPKGNARQELSDQLTVFSATHTKKNTARSSEIVSESLPQEGIYILKLPQWPDIRLPTNSLILDSVNEHFHQAVAHIQKQDSIGVYLGGPSTGRDGILSWLTIATISCTFLFDIQILNEKAFKKGGLKDILENPKTEKILHDCRDASDCLHHKFNTKLINVFDTQVADLFVTLQSNKKGTMPQKVNTLNFCLAKYLNIPDSFLPKTKDRSYIDNVLHYSLRPLRNETKDLLMRRVIYLRPLKQKLNRLMLNPFHRAVEVYLQVVQSASDRELLLEIPCVEEIPLQLVMEGLQTVRLKNSESNKPSENTMNTIQNYTTLCKSSKMSSAKNAIGDECNSTSASKLHYEKEIYFAFEDHTIANYKSCIGSKNMSVEDSIMDNNVSTHSYELPQVNLATQNYTIEMPSHNNPSVKSDDSSSLDESHSQADSNGSPRHFKYKNTDKLSNYYTEGISNITSDMNCKQNLHKSDSLNKLNEMSKKDKFRLSRLKFSINSSCQIEHKSVTSNDVSNPEVKVCSGLKANTESTLPKNDILIHRRKNNGISSLEEDPYAKLREAFSVPYNTSEEINKKGLKFFPAGMNA